MSKLDIYQFGCLSDNFGVLIHDAAANLTAAIDAPEAGAVRNALREKGWNLTHIFVTHHHSDHTDGIAPLKAETGCTVIGPKGEAAKIKGLDKTVAEPESFAFGNFEVKVIDTPGHTAGHITYWIPSAKVAFAGDTIFAIGCGRIIEGTPQMMWTSLQKIAHLPLETEVYCGHEYTLSNARFALTIEPENRVLVARVAEVEALREEGKFTLPTTVGLELQTNPFLRPQAPDIRARLGMEDAQDWQVFAEIRERKNRS